MSTRSRLDRRGFLAKGLAIAGASLLGGCDSELSDQPWVRRILDSAETLTRLSQRALIPATALAREYREADISKDFKANGSTDVDDDDYRALAANGFADWKLKVDGLVGQPLELTLAELRAMPSRTQITRHDCVEGWSCIGKWTGVQLKALLDKAELKPSARYIVFYCADDLAETGDDEGKYYEFGRSHRRVPPADHPRLRHERRGAADRAWRAAQASGRATARLQDGEICDADRSGRRTGAHSWRPGRLLGRSRLRVVRRDLRRARLRTPKTKEGSAGVAREPLSRNPAKRRTA